jgi:NAD+ diphosphatase
MIAVISSRDGQRILLARSPRHPPKLHTTLAGFVEVGETFEAAVAREAFEETGVIVDEGSTKYIGSQPWPFPQSCMIGFLATADDTTPLNIDTKELVSAQWFDKDQVRAATTVPGATMQHAVAEATLNANPDLPLLLPPKGVIARKLIDTWLEQQ